MSERNTEAKTDRPDTEFQNILSTIERLKEDAATNKIRLYTIVSRLAGGPPTAPPAPEATKPQALPTTSQSDHGWRRHIAPSTSAGGARRASR